MSHFDYELKMDNEFDAVHTGAAGLPAVTGGNEDKRYFKETIKVKDSKGGLKRFIAGILILLIAGAPLIGIFTGVGLRIADKYLGTDTPQSSSIPAQEQSADSLTPSLSPIAANTNSSIVELVREAQLSVVNITTSIATNDYFYRHYFYGQSQETPGSGTGIVFKEDDENVYIITNYHVVENANKAFVSFTEREQIPAKLVGGNQNDDVAVISVAKSALEAEGVTDIRMAKIGDSSAIEVGEWVVAIGNALGNGKTVTYGIVSAIDKEMDFSNGQNALNFIQTDAAINPGNSGGALVDMDGNVIGMNTAKIADYRVDGMGFAIPINSVVEMVNVLLDNNGSSQSAQSENKGPFIGIVGASITAEIVDYFSLIVSEGVIIDSVLEDGGAYDAGLREGDIITELDGQKISSIEQLQSIIANKEAGSNVTAKIIRNNEREIDVIIKVKDRSEVYTIN